MTSPFFAHRKLICFTTATHVYVCKRGVNHWLLFYANLGRLFLSNKNKIPRKPFFLSHVAQVICMYCRF